MYLYFPFTTVFFILLNVNGHAHFVGTYSSGEQRMTCTQSHKNLMFSCIQSVDLDEGLDNPLDL